jgi:hypothetical protein
VTECNNLLTKVRYCEVSRTHHHHGGCCSSRSGRPGRRVVVSVLHGHVPPTNCRMALAEGAVEAVCACACACVFAGTECTYSLAPFCNLLRLRQRLKLPLPLSLRRAVLCGPDQPACPHTRSHTLCGRCSFARASLSSQARTAVAGWRRACVECAVH